MTNAVASDHLDPIATLQRTFLFRGVSGEALEKVRASATEVRANAGEFLIRERGPSNRLLIIIEGKVEILKAHSRDSEIYRITTLAPGQTIGELGLLNDEVASASARAIVPSRLLSVPISTMKALVKENAAFGVLFKNLAGQLNQRLRCTNEVTVRSLANELEHAKARVGLAVYLVTLVILVTAFSYALAFFSLVAKTFGNTTVVTLPLSLLGLGVICYKIRNSGFPRSFYGVTTANWKRATIESILYSIPILGVAQLLKWFLVTFIPRFQGLDNVGLFGLLEDGNTAVVEAELLKMIVYVLLVVPIQEFATRGAMQGLLQEFLTGPNRVFWAIVSSNLMFSVAHLFISPQFALVSFFLGLFWGWLYFRHRTLISPILSHALIGAVGGTVIGMIRFLT